jgi:hypothetical protein
MERTTSSYKFMDNKCWIKMRCMVCEVCSFASAETFTVEVGKVQL